MRVLPKHENDQFMKTRVYSGTIVLCVLQIKDFSSIADFEFGDDQGKTMIRMTFEPMIASLVWFFAGD